MSLHLPALNIADFDKARVFKNRLNSFLHSPTNLTAFLKIFLHIQVSAIIQNVTVRLAVIVKRMFYCSCSNVCLKT